MSHQSYVNTGNVNGGMGNNNRTNYNAPVTKTTYGHIRGDVASTYNAPRTDHNTGPINSPTVTNSNFQQGNNNQASGSAFGSAASVIQNSTVTNSFNKASSALPMIIDGVPIAADSSHVDLTARDDLPSTYEALLKKVDTKLPISFLLDGANISKAVVLITLPGGERGSGVRISKNTLLTNHHVLPDIQTATKSKALFYYDAPHSATVSVTLKPTELFVTNAEPFDFTIVKFEPGPLKESKDDEPGVVPLKVDHNALKKDLRLYIIQHPGGQTKQVSIHGNVVAAIKEHHLWYTNDTEYGSSGSPVFNSSWEMVALHHANVPKKDEQDRILRRDGQVWNEGDPVPTIRYIANEGIRVIHIVKALEEQAAKSGTSAETKKPIEELINSV